MRDFLAILFLLMFGVCTLLTYLAIRRRWTRVWIAAMLGLLGDTLTMGWASLARGTWLPQAMLTGCALGLMFTGMVVSIAMFYRATPPGEPPNPPRKPAIQPVSSLKSTTPAASPNVPPRQPADENT